MFPHRSSSLVLLIAVGLLGACSTIKVDSDYDPSADFSNLRTFAWLPAPVEAVPDQQVSDLVTQRIRRAVEAELVMQGMRPVESGPDLYIAHHINIEQKLEVNTTSYGYGYGGSRYRGGMAVDTHVDQYEQGTLVVDLVSPETMNVIWRGTAQSRLRSAATPQQREERVKEAVSAIFAQYPPE